MKELSFRPAKPVHPYAWLWEPLEDDPPFILRTMFGTRAVYLDGRLVLCFSTAEEPWRGVLVCTEREHHTALLQEFSDLTPHPILPKWLYLRETSEGFERVAQRLVRLAKRRDPRLGIIPPRRRPRARPDTGRRITRRRP